MGHKDLPLASGTEHEKAFKRAGWARVRQTGSHIIMEKEGCRATLSVPNHSEVKRALLADLIEAAEMMEDEYCSCFKGKRLDKIRAAADAAKDKARGGPGGAEPKK